MSHASQPDPRDPTLPREHAGASATQSSTQELLALLQRTIFPAQAVTVAQKMLQAAFSKTARAKAELDGRHLLAVIPICEEHAHIARMIATDSDQDPAVCVVAAELHAVLDSTVATLSNAVVTYAGRTAFPGHAKRQAQVAMAASDQSKSLHKELTLINQKLLLHTMRDMVDSSHVQHAATRHDSEAVMHQSKSMQQDHVTARPAYPKAMHIPQSPQEKQALESKPEKSALLQLQPSAIAVASSVMTQSAVTPTSGAGLSIASSGENGMSTGGAESVAASASQCDTEPAQLTQSELDDALAGCLNSSITSIEKEVQGTSHAASPSVEHSIASSPSKSQPPRPAFGLCYRLAGQGSITLSMNASSELLRIGRLVTQGKGDKLTTSTAQELLKQYQQNIRAQTQRCLAQASLLCQLPQQGGEAQTVITAAELQCSPQQLRSVMWDARVSVDAMLKATLEHAKACLAHPCTDTSNVNNLGKLWLFITVITMMISLRKDKGNDELKQKQCLREDVKEISDSYMAGLNKESKAHQPQTPAVLAESEPPASPVANVPMQISAQTAPKSAIAAHAQLPRTPAGHAATAMPAQPAVTPISALLHKPPAMSSPNAAGPDSPIEVPLPDRLQPAMLMPDALPRQPDRPSQASTDTVAAAADLAQSAHSAAAVPAVNACSEGSSQLAVRVTGAAPQAPAATCAVGKVEQDANLSLEAINTLPSGTPDKAKRKQRDRLKAEAAAAVAAANTDTADPGAPPTSTPLKPVDSPSQQQAATSSNRTLAESGQAESDKLKQPNHKASHLPGLIADMTASQIAALSTQQSTQHLEPVTITNTVAYFSTAKHAASLVTNELAAPVMSPRQAMRTAGGHAAASDVSVSHVAADTAADAGKVGRPPLAPGRPISAFNKEASMSSDEEEYGSIQQQAAEDLLGQRWRDGRTSPTFADAALSAAWTTVTHTKKTTVSQSNVHAQPADSHIASRKSQRLHMQQADGPSTHQDRQPMHPDNHVPTAEHTHRKQRKQRGRKVAALQSGDVNKHASTEFTAAGMPSKRGSDTAQAAADGDIIDHSTYNDSIARKSAVGNALNQLLLPAKPKPKNKASTAAAHSQPSAVQDLESQLLLLPARARLAWIEQKLESDELCCPLSLNTFQDPVIAADGRTYERSEINQWLAKGDLSPWTLMPLAHLRVETDIQVQAQLDMLNAYRSEITAQRLADL